jgi:GNAT superfamily N-acetyltransferase
MSGAKSKYTTKLGNKKVYDIATDPEGLIANAREKANEKMINRGVFTHDDMHDAIKASGYHGFRNSSLGPQMGNVIAMYHPMDVEESPIKFNKDENDLIIKLNDPSYVLKKNVSRISVPKEKGISSRPDQQVYPASMSSGKTIRKPTGADTNYIKSKIESSHLNEKYQKFTPDEAEDSAHRISRSLKNNGPTRGVFIANKRGNHQAWAGGEGEGHTTEHEGFHLLSQQILDKYGPEKHLKFLQDLSSHIHPQIRNIVHGSLQSNPNYRSMFLSSNPRYNAAYLEEAINLTRDLNVNPNYRKQIKDQHNVDERGISTLNNPYHTQKYRDMDSWLKNSWKKIVNHAKNYNFKDHADQPEQLLAASEKDVIIKTESDLEKGVKSTIAGLGLIAGLGMNPSMLDAPKEAPVQQQESQKSSFAKFGTQPEDHFLHNIMQVETSGGKNLNHPKIKYGMHKGSKAIGKFALMPHTIKEVTKRYNMQGKSHPEIDTIHDMPTNQVSDYISKNPHVELELARTLANHVIKKHGGDLKRAAYGWKYGHNLSSKDVNKTKLKHDPYLNNFESLTQGKSVVGLIPASTAFGDPRRVASVVKSEDLEKGESGDWKKEGYRLRIEGEPSEGNTFTVHAEDRKGGSVGYATFHHKGSHLHPADVEVNLRHRRKGLASGMYEHAENKTKTKIKPSEHQSKDAKAMWASRVNKTEDLEKGINGDWQSEGYKLKLRQLKDGNRIYAYGPDNKKVGHVLYTNTPSKTGHLRVHTAHLDEDHRGKGIYQAMLNMAANHAKDIGHKGIMSEGFQRSSSATRAWEKVANNQVDSGYPVSVGVKQPDGSYTEEKIHQPKIDYFINKSEEDLLKGSFQSRNKSKVSPEEYENTKKWVNATTTVDATPSPAAKEARENLQQPPEMLNRLKQRLSKITHLRKHPETGEVMALLHRGMSHDEYDANRNGLNINHDHATSWTPKKSIASNFSQNDGKRLVSAWIPISKITSAPWLVPDVKAAELVIGNDRLFEVAPRNEQEIIVGPDHNSLITHATFEPAKDTIGEKVKNFKADKRNRDFILNQHKNKLAASENTEPDLLKDENQESQAAAPAPKQLTGPVEPVKLQTQQAPKVKINPEHGLQIANAYDQMKHDPNHPDVKAAYGALIGETKNQFQDLMKKGLKISRITPDMENPYKSSKDLHNDIEQNNHMWYYPTEQVFGSGDQNQFPNHPMLQPTGIKHGGNEMLANDLFRVAHDYFGHFAEGKTGFGPTGEHQAFIKHKKMFSPLAQKALATETLGQNSTVNFGKHAEHNRKNPSKTIYADQKAGLLPDNIINQKWHGEE